MDCSRDLTKSTPLKRAPVIFHWSLMCSVQGGTCLGKGNEASYNAFPIAFSSTVTVVPYAFRAGHYIDYLNLNSQSLAGFSVFGAYNGSNWQRTSGLFIAIGV